MIAAVRGLGFTALYVSGYIRTIPRPGKERLAGADASHAWISVWCGSKMGWKDFDPTNAQAVQNDYIVVARGRDYSEAAPIESLVLSSGRHTLDVEVDVVPIDADTALGSHRLTANCFMTGNRIGTCNGGSLHPHFHNDPGAAKISVRVREFIVHWVQTALLPPPFFSTWAATTKRSVPIVRRDLFLIPS